MPAWTGFYDLLVYASPLDAPVRPFLAAGAQFSKFNPDSNAARIFGTAPTTKPGMNYGGGVKIPVHRYLVARFDFREYAMPKPFNTLIAQSGWMRTREFTGGLALVF